MCRRKIELWEDIQRSWLAIIECLPHGMSEMKRHELAKAIYISDLRCFDTVFQRPYRYFSIALKVVFPCTIAKKFSSVIGYGLKFVKM